MDDDRALTVLILGAGRMCEPAVTYLAFHGTDRLPSGGKEMGDAKLQVVVASLYLHDAQKVTYAHCVVRQIVVVSLWEGIWR